MNINNKLLTYLEFKGISQRKFTANCKLSEGVLRGGNNLGSGYLKIIKQNYPDLNMDWLLFDKGNMIVDDEIGNTIIRNDSILDEKTANIEFESLVISIFEKKYGGKLKAMQRQLEIMFQQKLREGNANLENKDAFNKNNKTG